MKIKDVLEKVDALYPNVFDDEQKLSWCYEVTTDLLTDNPIYKSIDGVVVSDGDPILLPEGVVFSQVERVYINGVRQTIYDERVLQDAKLKKGDKFYVAWKCVPKEYELDENGEVPDELEAVCPSPYDSMYIDYVCAQIAYWQNDLSDYNKFLSNYNSKKYSYCELRGAKDPLGDVKKFVNLF